MMMLLALRRSHGCKGEGKRKREGRESSREGRKRGE
jgi:hypothetical protein